jgi:hypothetical protein
MVRDAHLIGLRRARPAHCSPALENDAMSKLRLAAAVGLSLLLPLGVSSAIAAAPAAAPAPAAKAAPAKATPTKSAAKARSARKTDITPTGVVEPESLAALMKMGAYLKTLTSFEVKTQTGLDIVTNDGQRVQMNGEASYKVHRPNGFVISVNTDAAKRTYYYDGKVFTIYSPDTDFYAQAKAPPTIKQTLDVLYDKFGISLPLEDLFRWSDPTLNRSESLTSGFKVGPSTIGGVLTDQYAFREGDIDWQIWIQHDGSPLPLKMVIIDRTDPADPAYIAQLTWNTSPSLTDDDFTFKPDADAKLIRMASQQ